MLKFEKIGSKQTLSAEIVEKIGNEILSNNILPGEKLPTEMSLSGSFGVSRASIREALQILSAQGLITVKKGVGAFVTDISSEHVNMAMQRFFARRFDNQWAVDIIMVRQLIEPPCARLAALHATTTDIDNLEKILLQFIDCDEGNYQKWGDLDELFHLKISELSGNPVIPLLMDPIFTLMPLMRANVYKIIDKAHSSASDYHARIFNAIKNKNPELAHDLMMKHLKFAEEHSRQVLNSE